MIVQEKPFLDHFWYSLPAKLKSKILANEDLRKFYNRFLGGEIEDDDFFKTQLFIEGDEKKPKMFFGIVHFLNYFKLGSLMTIGLGYLTFRVNNVPMLFYYKNEHTLQLWDILNNDKTK